jgi:UDP:flavonoid glycosyltransferase YjiC (YdhE family)
MTAHRMAHMIIVTKGSHGDLVPCVALGAALRSRAHHVSLVTHRRYASMVNNAGLTHVACDTAAAGDAFIADGGLLDRPASIPEFARRHVFPTLADEYALIADCCDTSDTVLIVRHMGSLAAEFVAERLNLPLVVLFTAVAQASCLPLLERLYSGPLESDINENRSALGLPTIVDWRQWCHRARMYLASWPSWFADPLPTWPQDVRTVGFLRADALESGNLPNQVTAMFDHPGPAPVLITGGTAVWVLASRFYEVAARACARVGRQGILVCPHDELIPGELPPSIKRFARLPFASLAPRVAAVVHHGGSSISARAIAARIPQLVMPYGGDRPDNGRRVERLGLGKCLLPGQWEETIVAEALATVLSSTELRLNCVQASVCDDDTALDSGCSAIEQLARM